MEKVRNGLYLSEVDVPLDINHYLSLASGWCAVSFIWILYICKLLDRWPIDHQLCTVRRLVCSPNINLLCSSYLLSNTKTTVAEMPKGGLRSAKEALIIKHTPKALWKCCLVRWMERDAKSLRLTFWKVFTKWVPWLQAEEQERLPADWKLYTSITPYHQQQSHHLPDTCR